MLVMRLNVMDKVNFEQNRRRGLYEGYRPNGFVTREVDGKEVRIPTADVEILPPKGKSGVVRLKNRQPEKGFS
jgi:hypothetical protein